MMGSVTTTVQEAGASPARSRHCHRGARPHPRSRPTTGGKAGGA
ncbi:hypothetical protein Ae168Ps1_1364c [Pseudonocardia sp. Ae168_Ps1]|nr:hypothetical protein Ae168Ps1_1364c [Pseudonocardia sp. Ae168_Ps1]